MKSKNEFSNKNILVTGGTGSIGLEIVRQLLKYNPGVVRIFARHEDRHHYVMQELGNKKLRFIIGDIRDKDRLKLAMEDVDIVFHAAALKHVPLCEYNPFEAVKTNIIGTQNVIESARETGVKKVISISTDKVVDPTGVLGTSKLMGEKLSLAPYFSQDNEKTRFSCVRFGNVLGSRGSILPLIKKQVFGKGVVTVTDPDMTRFVMTIPQAVRLVLDASSMMKGREVFILKMPSVRLSDLVKTAIEYYAPLAGKKIFDIKIKYIGKRDGEKGHERLLADYEIDKALETKDMYILASTPLKNILEGKLNKIYSAVRKKTKNKEFFSEHAPQLSHKELFALIKEADAD